MDLTKLLAVSAVLGGVMPFVAALAQRPGAERWNLLVRVVLALVAGGIAVLAVCPVVTWECVAASLAVIVAAAQSSYSAWTKPAVDALTAATSPKARTGRIARAPGRPA
ncbi:MAG TPA: hypothetical protein VG276_28810 [Actinomycetes bacterium]|jgi:uncharacterized membrane protein HdeD (DUF308 family)|nr:hypothetical protein [Actinomycetes bacterium]